MIEAKFEGRLLVTNNTRLDEALSIELYFDEENDPLAVQMVFKHDEDEVCWTVGRELLMRGSVSRAPYGSGDVGFRAEPNKNRILACLKSPEGHADIGLPQDEVIRFLNRTMAACRFGGIEEEETVSGHVDALIAEIFEEDAA